VDREARGAAGSAGDESARRLSWVAGGVLLWGLLILAKLIYLQAVQHKTYVKLAQQQQEKMVEIPAPRGPILDRNGQPLAISVPMVSVFVNPLRLPDLAVASSVLAPILELDQDALYGRIKWAAENHRGFLWIKRKIASAQAERLRNLRLEWIEFQTESQRHYPTGSLAAHVLGSVDHEEQGNGGIELGLEQDLRGHPGSARLLTDVKRRGIDSHLATEPHDGASVTLTIDERIQFAAERELKNAVIENHCKTGSVVVMNPHSGEILALANYPTYDPNKPPGPGEPAAARFDLAVSVPFEPGSVFKVITVSAALETTRLNPESRINCGNGVLRLPGRVIHEAKRGYGVLSMADVLAKSSNIGAIQIGMTVGPANLYEYVRRFGFGSRSGIPLPAESAGMLRKLSRWGSTSLASVAMGHEISTTALQLSRACSVVANGGLLVKPKLVAWRGGQTVSSSPPRRILKAETAITMRRLMEGVVLHGTGKAARLDGFTSGGKTGTAQIFDFAARRYTHLYNASYMGFAPVTNPAIVVVVTLNGASKYGGVLAAPVFRSVAMEALRVLDVPKDLPDSPPVEVKPRPEEVNDLSIAELSNPEPPEMPAMPVPVTDAGPRAPNFQGKTMRAVVEEASAMGLTVLLDGSGTARIQSPPPGAALQPGERIRVQFAR
jgi:cell division protein FtsI (penicillin-binding protein 3)